MEITIKYFEKNGVYYFGDENEHYSEFSAKCNIINVDNFDDYCKIYLEEVPNNYLLLYI